MINCIFCDFKGTLPELKEHSAHCEKHPAVIKYNELYYVVHPLIPMNIAPEIPNSRELYVAMINGGTILNYTVDQVRRVWRVISSQLTS